MNNLGESLKQIWDSCINSIADISATMEIMNLELPSAIFTLIIRWILPLLAITILWRCILPLLQVRKQKAVWGYLYSRGGAKTPIKHWENSIGRSNSSDIVINLPYISKNHAVLTFRDGTWFITDLNSKNGVKVNGEKIEKTASLTPGDVISLGGKEMVLFPGEKEAGQAPQLDIISSFISSSKQVKTGVTFFLILLFQALGCLQVCLSMGDNLNPIIPQVFLLFIFVECLFYFITRQYSRKYFELELLCFFLCGLNLLIVASAAPHSLFTQLLAIVFGIAVYMAIEAIIRDLGRANRLKYILVASALVLLVLNLTIGEVRFGAKRWIDLGFITFQPSEFVKIAFIMAGTATLDRLLTVRNMTAFIGFTAICVGSLVLMRDFGMVVVFFGAFIVIAFMRSGDLRTIALTSSGAVLGAIAVTSFIPYIATRLEAWGNVWDHAYTIGYQQTQTMIAAASGGLIGVGGGNGYLSGIAAADTDLVFGMLCEEWGLLIAFIAVFIIVFFSIYALLLTKKCRSSFYAIAACGAASIFLIQTALNVLGSVDVLPLTGITIPFISRGGSSMIASWGLLALIKSADERLRPKTKKYYIKEGDRS